MKRLHPKAILLFFLRFISRWFVILFLFEMYLIFAVTDAGIGMSVRTTAAGSVVAAMIALIVLYGCALLDYYLYGYELMEHHLNIKHGIFIKKAISIPYNHIQHIEIIRGILRRLLGLSDMRIKTAGMASQTPDSTVRIGEARLPGISREDAEHLKDELLARTKDSTMGAV